MVDRNAELNPITNELQDVNKEAHTPVRKHFNSLIYATGEKVWETFEPAGEVYTLDELQGAVGGYIEIIYLSSMFHEYLMVIDEEGKVKGKAMNMFATQLAESELGGDVIVGDVVVCRRELID